MPVLKIIYCLGCGFPLKIAKICIAIFVGLVLVGMKSQQDDKASSETQLKAVFLYNFTQFIEWPAGSFGSNESPFIIGVLGKNTFGTYLDEVIEGETVAGRPIVIKYYPSVLSEIGECQILFIQKASPEITKATQFVKGKPILTVSDAENFMKQSGMLRFYVESGKIRFEINKEVSSQSGLTISSKLMRLATLYKG